MELKSITVKYWYLAAICTLFCTTSPAQQFNLTTEKNDFTPIEVFFHIADSIRIGAAPSAAAWAGYFNIPVVSLFTHAPGFDSTVFVNDMKTVFGGAGHTGPTTLTDQQRLMQAYKDNEEKIKTAIAGLKKQNIEDSIKRLVYPYLPKQLRKDSLLPRQLFLFLDEGNGGLPGYVFNSMLQTAQVLPYRSCIISAHETYHSIIGGVFGAKLETPKAATLPDEDKSLLFFLEQVAEEGIADQIDKPLLEKPASPFYAQVKKLEEGEDVYAILYVTRLDSLLRTASHQHKTPAFDFSQFSKNGGHIPGRYMANSIRKAGLMPACIDSAGDPVAFVACYKKAAGLTNRATISDEAMAYLQQLGSKL